MYVKINLIPTALVAYGNINIKFSTLLASGRKLPTTNSMYWRSW
jgi:hypothetical protein